MARNLSERMLDMVERDRRFIGLSDSAVLLWIKLMWLYRRGELPACTDADLSNACSLEEICHFLRLPRQASSYSWDLDILVGRQLLFKIGDKFCAPPEIGYPDSGPVITIVQQN